MTAIQKLHFSSGYCNEDDKTIFQKEDVFGAHHYERIGLVVRHAKGCWLTDDKGNRYLDCLAAYSAANPGHHHPAVTHALIDALKNQYGSDRKSTV